MRYLLILGSGFVLFAFAASSFARAEVGSRDEAIAMVKRVQAKFEKDGADATFKAVTTKAKVFHDRDLYPFVYDMTGLSVAHGSKAELVGKNLLDFKDQNGKFLIREMIDITKTTGSGWVDYRWTNPTTKKVEDKSAYVEKMGEYLVGVGVYRLDQGNQNTIAIISGSPNSDDTYLQVAYDLAAVLNNGDELRILPVVGIGGSQNIRDVLTLKGIDIGLTQTSVLNNYRSSNLTLGASEDKNKLVYIAKLFNQEVHLIARSNITKIEQLQGAKVSFDQIGSGTNFAMRDIFRRLGIKVEEVNLTAAESVEKLKDGSIAATALVAGKPSRFVSGIQAAAGFHLLSVPFEGEVAANYFPVTLTSADYPGLIPEGEKVTTVADGVVLIAYNWPRNNDRYRRVKKFVEAFFPRIAEFQKPPRHAKWSEANIAAKLTGWERFEPAEAWLTADKVKAPSDLRESFEEFLVSRQNSGQKRFGATDSNADAEQLFQSFLKWRQGKPEATTR